MKISQQEKAHAARFAGLLFLGMTLIAAVLMAWAKAVAAGGSWWFLFVGCGLGAVAGGEIIKARMEWLLKMSREARAQARTIAGRSRADHGER